MTPKLKLATDALYVPMRVAETFASLVVSFPEPDDDSAKLAEGQKKYVRTMTCVGVLYHFDQLSSDQRRAWTNALSECLRRDPPTYEDVMEALREASERSSTCAVHRVFGSTICASANSLDKRVRDELGVTNLGYEGTKAYALKIVEKGIENGTIPSALREPLTFGFVETQFVSDVSDGSGMEVGMEV